MNETKTKKRTTAAPELGGREMLRWLWRQLTSMRTALFLLLLLAIAAVPGSLIPQRGVDAQAVQSYFARNPELAPVLDDLGFFSVYTSPWFSAIYLLLMVSLVGCIIPRAVVYAKALRARPPKAPRNLLRLPVSTSLETDASLDEVVAAARTALRGHRVDVVTDDGTAEVRAEKGYLREAGNLVFHVSLVVVLVGVAAGTLFGYRGSAVVVEGTGFSNSLTQYDEFSSGSLFEPHDLPPFSLQMDDVTARFQTTGEQRGAPRQFRAQGSYTAPDGDTGDFDIQVNHPLSVDGTDVFLVGQGYAPVVKVTDPKGNVAFDGPVPFLPEDPTYTSSGVVKVPDAQPYQIGFQGFFLPTAVTTGDDEASVSVFPAAANPILGLFAWTGDLGLDAGVPQSVYVLDKDEMEQVKNPDGSNFRISLSPGQEQVLPDGTKIQFVELRQFARLQIAASPGKVVPLVGVSVGVLGLILSLAIKPRRTWIRARREGSRTIVEVAALDRVPRGDVTGDLDDLLERLALEAPKEKAEKA
ncbi:cytochrome c biogenesis protein ResB [Aeromicrobium massiliense]|uniref:cytochrome c biogenesis protein ResB n=1 Tax=Aeromicrobium massiliense TaxID=1464554 RepID=UPI000302C926|nr:cytochrome c biogenesis protein ResB [Aeromicrobium massiliense]